MIFGWVWSFSSHSLDSPPLKKEGVNFNYLPRSGESEKLKKGNGSMVQGQVFLKGALTLLLFNFFKVYHFYI